MLRLATLLTLFTAAASPVHAQPVDGTLHTTKRVYAFVDYLLGDDPPGSLVRTETETYAPDGRRLGVEWVAADGTVELAFAEFYRSTDSLPYLAAYTEEGASDLNRETSTYRPDPATGGTLRQTTYYNAAGEVTGVTDFTLDAEGRERVRRYAKADGVPYAVDSVRYAGPNTLGYTSTGLESGRRVAYTYDVQTVDARGNWTSQLVLRDGELRLLETREIVYRE